MASRACQGAARTTVHPALRRAGKGLGNAGRIQRSAVLAQASLTGRWEKDLAASESMDETCAVFELNFAVKQAVKLLKIMDIEDTDESFKTSINAVLLSIDETYPKSGKPMRYKRRDLRSGDLAGSYQLSEDNCPTIVAEWEEPVKGSCTDVFQLHADGDTLTQYTSYVRASTGQTTQFKTVHRRVSTPADEDSW